MKTLSCLLATAAVLTASSLAEISILAATGYSEPNSDSPRIGKRGIDQWTDPTQRVSWFGEFKHPGDLRVGITLKLEPGATSRLKLTVGGTTHELTATGTGKFVRLWFGYFPIDRPGYHRLELTSLNPAGTDAGTIEDLRLDGPAVKESHFNQEPRRNAASVHLSYPLPKEFSDQPIVGFYNEVTAIEEPTATYYMACGFSRGYFGMQVNSLTERRILFSVWDAGSGQSAMNRSTVSDENHTQLLAKGDDVTAAVFGNEGTGGQSYLKYPWKTGEAQKFYLTAKPGDGFTDYSGYWLHPETKQWKFLATFRAPKDGKGLRGLYSFSENFNGANGQLRRKAVFGPQWVATADGQWHELLTAKFSHDGTGKDARLDRFMGVEQGKFFLSQGGFVPGFTKTGETFTREPSGIKPVVELPPAAPAPAQ